MIKEFTNHQTQRNTHVPQIVSKDESEAPGNHASSGMIAEIPQLSTIKKNTNRQMTR